MLKRLLATLLLVAGMTAGCTFEVPSFDDDAFEDIFDYLDNLADRFEEGAGDPLDQDPYPVLLGGDSVRVLYATNLGDIRITFEGEQNEIIIPGLIGPSNLYEIRDDERSLLQPFVLAGALTGLVTDGDVVAHTLVPDPETPQLNQLVAGSVYSPVRTVIFSTDATKEVIDTGLAIDDRRVAFTVFDLATLEQTLFAVDVDAARDTVAVAGGVFDGFDLFRNWMAYAVSDDQATVNVELVDLTTQDVFVLATDLPYDGGYIPVYLTDNLVVWSEPTGGGLNRVMVYDIPADEVLVWADAVEGELVGANDDWFVTEDLRDERLYIKRYDIDADARGVDDFRATGLAGQTMVAGDRIIWVTPDHRINIKPISGGDTERYRPYDD